MKKIDLNDLVMREMFQDDLPEVFELEKVCFADPWSVNAFSETLSSNVGEGFVALVNGKMIGYLVGWSILDEGHLLNVAVEPGYRGTGIGRKIVEDWIKSGRARGWSLVFLEVRENNTPAVNLYESLGFEKVGVRKAYYSDGEDALLMTLSFTSSEAGRE